jgi:hypothetical protein
MKQHTCTILGHQDAPPTLLMNYIGQGSLQRSSASSSVIKRGEVPCQRLSEVIKCTASLRREACCFCLSVMQQQRTAAWWRWRSLVHNERGLCNGGRERRPPTTTNRQKSTSGEPCLSFCTSDGLTFCLKLHTYGVHAVVVQPLLQARQMWIAYKGCSREACGALG